MNNSNPRTLYEICNREEFTRELLGDTYCSLATTREPGKVDCPCIVKKRDHNDLYLCLEEKEARKINEQLSEREEFESNLYEKLFGAEE